MLTRQGFFDIIQITNDPWYFLDAMPTKSFGSFLFFRLIDSIGLKEEMRMLEVRNLSKIYKSKVKNGVDTHALDGVSLQFPEKGMVFLLGKSGSGKSTLLNVCGGLDSPTEGEIIVKGRSSKDFSQSDFDSYRNTFVGFIFQEYNILNEFTVEDNIALALELQGKPKDKKVIAELLEQVDLTGFAKRKPNTLSGGQKQRIAIARALVKSPEIIMADEPTGALDSTTGKQVFDTLKKLSRDKLVMVVSHDREFAELYADRIIELKDGKVLSDVSKSHQKQEAISDNVNALGDVLCIKSGSALNERDLEKINAFLRKSKGDVIIANGEKDVQNFKKANRITEDGEKEVFLDTDESKQEKKNYRPEDSKFIRSKLPARHAAKIGVSGLKSKPVRLVFTIILCVVSFVLFGLLTTLNFYNSESMFKQTLTDSAHDYITLGKEYEVDVVWYMNGEAENEYTTSYDALFSQKEIDAYRAEFGNDVFGGVRTMINYTIRSQSSDYWVNTINTVAYLPADNALRGSIQGNYPTKNDEICISSYIANVIYHCGLTDSSGTVTELNSAQEIIGKSILINGASYKVVGILDSGEIDPKYDVIKDGSSDNFQLQMEFESALGDGMHLVAFFTEEKVEELARNASMIYGGMDNSYYRQAKGYLNYPGMSGEVILPEYSNTKYFSIAELDESNIHSFSDNQGALADNEVILTGYQTYLMIASYFSNKEWNYEGVENPYYELVEIAYSLDRNEKHVVTNPETGEGEFVPLTAKERESMQKQLLDAIDSAEFWISLQLMDSQNIGIGDEKTYRIVGIADTTESKAEYMIYVSEKEYDALWDEQKQFLDNYEEQTTAYKNDQSAFYSSLYLPYSHTTAETNTLWDIYSNEEYGEDDTKIKLTNSYIMELQMIDSMVQMFSQIFLYVGLVLALFAVLLFSNFISVSISQKKREIGILRAVGARSIDVFKIFFSESFVIALIAIVLSTAGTYVLCDVLNQELGAALGASIFVFGIPSFVVMVGVALLTAIIATFLPVWNAAKKKPVDSIRAL